MIIIGHELIPYQKQYLVTSIEDVAKTPSNSHLFLSEFDMELMSYLSGNSINYSVVLEKKHHAVIANALNATFIITSNPKPIQEIATNYLFDSKILTFIQNIQEIENLLKTNVDGVIFQEAIASKY